jgi:excisionase family DNA binding protein
MAEQTAVDERGIPRLLTLGEAARLLSVTRRTISEWAGDRLRVTYIGPRTPRILEADLIAFIDAARHAGQE